MPGAQNALPGHQIMNQSAVPGGTWTPQPAMAGVSAVQGSVPQNLPPGLQQQQLGKAAASGQVVHGGAIAGVPVWMPVGLERAYAHLFIASVC